MVRVRCGTFEDYSLIRVWVTTRSDKDEITGYDEVRRALKVKVKAPALEGKANAATKRVVAEALSIPPNRVLIVSGETSRLKILKILGIGGLTGSGFLERAKSRR
ncbi:MAG TPA: YggU family protein [Clostridia bacterium]|nr:YggU family protein [Clostridia bacterium]